jgi:DNA-binding MarR family transcriptional regulator
VTRQKSDYDDVYGFIKQYKQAHSISPSIREIADGTGRSLSGIARALDRLEELGQIERAGAFRARNIIIAEEQPTEAEIILAWYADESNWTYHGNGNWPAERDRGTRARQYFADTAPLAICRAALLASLEGQNIEQPPNCTCDHAYRHHDTEGGGCAICACQYYVEGGEK